MTHGINSGLDSYTTVHGKQGISYYRLYYSLSPIQCPLSNVLHPMSLNVILPLRSLLMWSKSSACILLPPFEFSQLAALPRTVATHTIFLVLYLAMSSSPPLYFHSSTYVIACVGHRPMKLEERGVSDLGLCSTKLTGHGRDCVVADNVIHLPTLASRSCLCGSLFSGTCFYPWSL